MLQCRRGLVIKKFHLEIFENKMRQTAVQQFFKVRLENCTARVLDYFPEESLNNVVLSISPTMTRKNFDKFINDAVQSDKF